VPQKTERQVKIKWTNAIGPKRGRRGRNTVILFKEKLVASRTSRWDKLKWVRKKKEVLGGGKATPCLAHRKIPGTLAGFSRKGPAGKDETRHSRAVVEDEKKFGALVFCVKGRKSILIKRQDKFSKVRSRIPRNVHWQKVGETWRTG